MFETICTLPLPSDLFAQSLHPTLPLLSVGLASGHVHTYRLPSSDTTNSEIDSHNGNNGGIRKKPRRDSSTGSENGVGVLETAWKTRRHKGSCRTLTFSTPEEGGSTLYSAGTDGIIKAAETETGVVVRKIAIPLQSSTKSTIDAPTLLHALSPQTLILGTEAGCLHIYDMREKQETKPAQTYRPHDGDEYISSLTPLPASETSTSGYAKQFVTTGGSTLAVTDLRKGVLVKSEDQEEELLCSALVSGLKASKGNKAGEKVLVGGGDGVVTLWERGVWDDQDERIVVDRGGEAVESLRVVPEGVTGGGGGNKHVAVGMADGVVKVVRLGMNKVVGEVRHDEVDGVVCLGFDVQGRMVSGGGSVVKIWGEEWGGDIDDEVVDGAVNGFGRDSDDDEEEVDGAKDSSEEEESKPKRKKRKRGKGKDRNGGGQHVMAFKGMD